MSTTIVFLTCGVLFRASAPTNTFQAWAHRLQQRKENTRAMDIRGRVHALTALRCGQRRREHRLQPQVVERARHY